MRSCVGVWVGEQHSICLLLDAFGRWTMKRVHENWQYEQPLLETTDWKPAKGTMIPSDKPEAWRSAGTLKLGKGFELTQGAPNQVGHLLCRVPFTLPEGSDTVANSEIHASLEYYMPPSENPGHGLVIYILDPSIEGWDTHFDGEGPLGFVGKRAALIGIGIDCSGAFSGVPDSVSVKRASDNVLLAPAVKVPNGIQGDDWHRVHVKFEIEENEIDVKVDGVKLLDNIPFDLGLNSEGVKRKIPRKVAIGVCAGTGDETQASLMSVNHVKLLAEQDD